MRTLTGVRNFYGASPLHLLALIGCFALAGYAALQTLANAQWPLMLVWFAGAIIAHDLVAFPLYALADRSLNGALVVLRPRRATGAPRVPAVNHVRVPALGAGLLFVLFFPGIIRQGRETYLSATGRTQQPYLGRWLLLVAAMFAASAVVYAVRLGRARATTPTGSLRAPRSGHTARRVAVAVWALLIVGTFVVGHVLRRTGHSPEDVTPPLHATARLLTWQLLPAIGAAVLLIAVLPVLARRTRWALLVFAGWAATALWTLALAIAEGVAGVTGPITTPGEYYSGLSTIGDHPLRWLATFTDRAQRYPIHVKGHPPAPTLILWCLDTAGLHGPGWPAALLIATGTSATAAIALTVKALAGEALARRTVPFLALAPLALWVATSMDALFLGIGAWAVALLAIAATRAGGAGRTAIGCAAVAGLLFGGLPYLSYGLLPLFALPLAVLVLTRPRWTVVAVAVGAMVVVPVVFTAAGFWWPDGVAATHQAYVTTGGSSRRSYLFFLVGDLAVLGLLTGPAVAYALPALAGSSRDGVKALRAPLERPPVVVALLVAAALLGTVVLDVAGLTRGEAERIWLPYAAWTLVATASHHPPGRRWLAAQAMTAVLVQAIFHSPW